MDSVVHSIVSFSALSFADLSESTIHETKRRIVDSFGCAFGASGSHEATAIRSVASHVTGTLAASAIGLTKKTTAEMASFANGAMVRASDFNESSASGFGVGHPSDMVPTAIAVGEAVGANGQDVIAALVIGYEVYSALQQFMPYGEWDYSISIVVSSAVMAAKLLCLNETELANAVSLAIVPHIPMYQSHVGELSMWKVCASGDAARNGVFAALLAQSGMTGPTAPFNGPKGMFDLISGPFSLELPVRANNRYLVEESQLKKYPGAGSAQGPVELILAMAKDLKVDDIEHVVVETFRSAAVTFEAKPERWNPQDRGEASRSMPYLLAAALADGRVDLSTLEITRITDPALRPLMQKISLVEREEFTRRHPAEMNAEITITTKNGRAITRHRSALLGGPEDPFTDQNLNDKFDVLAEATLDVQICQEVRSAFWELETLDTVTPTAELLGKIRPKV